MPIPIEQFAPILYMHCNLCGVKRDCVDMRSATDDSYGVSLCRGCLLDLEEYMWQIQLSQLPNLGIRGGV